MENIYNQLKDLDDAIDSKLVKVLTKYMCVHGPCGTRHKLLLKLPENELVYLYSDLAIFTYKPDIKSLFYMYNTDNYDYKEQSTELSDEEVFQESLISEFVLNNSDIEIIQKAYSYAYSKVSGSQQ